MQSSIDGNVEFVEFCVCSSREDFTFQLPSPFKREPADNNVLALDLKADIGIDVVAGS